MSLFYGILTGSRGEATRVGGKHSGITAKLAAPNGALTMRLRYDEETNTVKYSVVLGPWQDRGPETTIIAEGEFPNETNARD